MASKLNKSLFAETEAHMTTRLETIVTRQRQSRIRDLAFAAMIALAGAVSLSTVSTAAHAANANAEIANR